jgi:predicted TPR repeat methyltransferase
MTDNASQTDPPAGPAALSSQFQGSADEVAALYDEWADTYDTDIDASDYNIPEKIATMLSEHGSIEGEILDAGCGTGRSGEALRAIGALSMLGIDASAASLVVAERKGLYSETLTVDLKQKLPFADDRFTAAISAGVFTYLGNPEPVLRELLRVVRPAGVIIFSQRTDLWEMFDCGAIVQRLVDASLCEADVSTAQPYLPSNPTYGETIQLIYTALTVLKTDDAPQTDTINGSVSPNSQFQASTDDWEDINDTNVDALEYDVPEKIASMLSQRGLIEGEIDTTAAPASLSSQFQASTDEVAALYDAWADTYDTDIDALDYDVPEKIATMLSERGSIEGEILDAGCGTGLSGEALRAVGALNVLGTDTSATSLVVAERKGLYSETLTVDLKQKLPFADDRFTAAISAGVFTYLGEPEPVLKELLRVVRPAGVIIFSQRTDLWEMFDCGAIVQSLVEAGLCEADVSAAQPYLPNHPEYGDTIQVIYTTLTVLG